MKKTLTIYLFLLLISGSFAQSVFVANGISYKTTSDNTVEVTGNGGQYKGDINIPSTVKHSNLTYTVTSIGEDAFIHLIPSGQGLDYEDNIAMKSIILPNSITSIGNWAFSHCTGLTNIVLPNSITTIGKSAFSNCTGLTNIVLSNNISIIKSSTFEDCTSLKSITIPNSVTTIEDHAFIYCTNLNNVHLSDNLKSIGLNSFGICSNLTSINIPMNVIFIDALAFHSCANLSSINFPENITSIGQYAFDGTAWEKNQPSGAIYINNILYRYKESYYDTTVCEIKDGTTSISVGAFDNCIYLNSIIIPTSIISIPGYAFSKCTSLNSITIPNSVTSIGGSAFSGCKALKSISIPNSVTSIGGGAFSGCTALKTLTLPNNITAIPYNAFYSSGLNSIIIPSSVTSIGEGAFSSCLSLTDISLPNSIKSIDQYAFGYCTSLTSIVLPNSISTISLGTFTDCSKLISISMPNGITSINEDAFKNCSALDSIVMPDSVSIIGKSAFKGTAWYNKQPEGVVYINKVLYSYKGYLLSDSIIKVKDGTVSISNDAFDYCENINSITFPASLVFIGNWAFFGCYSLRSITVNAITPPTVISNAFLYIKKHIPVYVPVESYSLYKSAENWKDFNNIIGIPEYKNKKVNMVPTIVENGFHINGLDRSATLKLTDLNGKTIITKFIVNDEYISINWLPRGIYLLSITTIEGINKFKFMKE